MFPHARIGTVVTSPDLTSKLLRLAVKGSGALDLILQIYSYRAVEQGQEELQTKTIFFRV